MKRTRLKSRISEAQDRVSNLNASKADIDLLGVDENNIYALSEINGGEHHVRKGEDGKVYIETSSDALSIHEITHVRQSLNNGGLEFSSNGGYLKNAGNSIKGITNMEVEAYQMQYSYDRSFPGNKVSLKDINAHAVGGIMNNGVPVYPLIQKYSRALQKGYKVKNR